MRNKKFDQTRVDRVLDYIETSNDYSLEKFLQEKNLLKNSKVQGTNIMISCPYHSDSSPSMSINVSNDTFRCFANCGHEGGYINFIVQYSNEIEGSATNFYSILDDFIRKDRTMQSVLGFNSIYRVEDIQDIPQLILKKKIRINNTNPNSYSELHSMLGKLSKEDVLRMLSLIQDGLPPKEVFETMTYTDTQVNIFDTILNRGGAVDG